MDSKIETTITTTIEPKKAYDAGETKKAIVTCTKRAAIGTTVATTAVLTRNIASGYALGCAYNGRSKASARAMKVAAVADCVAVGATIITAVNASCAAYEAATMFENFEIQ